MKITGTVVYEDLEGGVWGIRSDDGQNFLPENGLPSRFRRPGRRVEAVVEPSDAVSMMMWGHTVRLLDIK